MSHLAPSTSSFQSTERISRGASAMSGESERQRGNSLYTTSIHILDDDSLLNIFYLYRPSLICEELEDQPQDVNGRFGGGDHWAVERWWHRLAHVCQRWRILILASPSYLGLCLVCTYGTPVADMLAYSPPLPLIIDYWGRDTTAKDEEAITLALAQRDRVRRIRFGIPLLKLQKLTMAIDGKYPILEDLILVDLIEEERTVLNLRETSQLLHLRHLMIIRFPMRLPLLGLAAGLVKLHLGLYRPYIYFQPATFLQSLSLMSQLRTLLITFHFAVPDSELMRTSIMTHATLPNLRTFVLRATRAYSEAVLSQITASRLEIFQTDYLEPLPSTFFVPQLVQFMKRTESLRFDRAKFEFLSERVYVGVDLPDRETNILAAFSIGVRCPHLDRQVSSVAQISNALGRIFSVVEHLTLVHQVHSQSSEGHSQVDRSKWRKLLGSFSNVKTLRVCHGLVEELSRCLRLDNGEHPLELLPELQELIYSGIGSPNDAFTLFIDARQNTGRPVALIKSNHT